MAIYDVILRGGLLLDGSGSSPYPADIGLVKQHIAAIGPLDEDFAAHVQDASGCVVCPGFIDTHSHTDLTIFDEPSSWNKLEQGVTTEINGMCGLSLAPVPAGRAEAVYETMPFLSPATGSRLDQFPDFNTLFEAYTAIKPGTNLAMFAGHGTLRAAVMGSTAEDPTSQQLAHMGALLSEAMQAGALGVSFGLIYPPGAFSRSEELATMARIAARYQGGISVHLRSEGRRLVESVLEMIEVARQTGAPLLLSHHKAAGKQNWGKINQTLALIDQANAEGILVSLDAYPYTASSTSLKTLIPAQFHAHGAQALLDLLASSIGRSAIREEMLSPDAEGETQFINAGFEGTLVIDSPHCPEAKGKTITQFAQAKGGDPFDVLFDILVADQLATMAAYFMMCDQDVETILKHPRTMIGTDGVSIASGTAEAPRAIGSFPRILGRYVRQQGLISLSEAVRKMTSLPADTLSLDNKGYVKVGYDADLVIFEPETVIDRADFEHFDAHNLGVRAVFVNGAQVVQNDRYLGMRAGRVLKNTKGRLL